MEKIATKMDPPSTLQDQLTFINLSNAITKRNIGNAHTAQIELWYWDEDSKIKANINKPIAMPTRRILLTIGRKLVLLMNASNLLMAQKI